MSFTGNTLYNLTWTGLFDQSNELRIKKSGYSGASTRIKCRGTPIIHNYKTPFDFILDPINGSTLTIYLVAETNFQFKDLYTSDARVYKVEHLIESSLEWSGFILPEQLQNAYTHAPYTNAFVAADQLGFLKTVPWENIYANTEYGFYTATLIEALDLIFDATDLELDIREGINMYETRQDDDDDESPLDQTYFHGLTYEGKSYYDVLKDILLKFTAVIKQRKGEWFIFRPIEARGDFITRLWSWGGSSFSYTSNTTTNLIKLTTAARAARTDLVRLGKGGQTMRPAWKQYTLKQDFGLATNRILNGDFTEWTGAFGNGPDRWQISPGITYNQIGNKLRLYGVTPREPAKVVFQQINTLVDYWEVRFKFSVFITFWRIPQFSLVNRHTKSSIKS